MLFPLAEMDDEATLQFVQSLLHSKEKYREDPIAYFLVFLIPPGKEGRACAWVAPSTSKGIAYGALQWIVYLQGNLMKSF